MLGFVAAAGSKTLLVDSAFVAVVVSSKQPLLHSAAVMLYLAVHSSFIPVCLILLFHSPQEIKYNILGKASVLLIS